ncbi:MAG: hypothetical protein QM589_17160 [Thermomicrobiales bacterium]
MDRRRFAALSASTLASLTRVPSILARQATPAADLPMLTIELTDTGFVVPRQIPAGYTALTVTNTSTNPVSHWLMASLPPGKTDAEIEEFLASEEDTEAIAFDDLSFIGVPDWPAPGGSVTGIVDLQPGTYLLLDPIGGRQEIGRTNVTGSPDSTLAPEGDLVVTLKDMTITLPDTAFTTSSRRWQIENIGSIQHDVTILPAPAELTEDDLMLYLSLPDDATPPPGVPALAYEPVIGIGVLSPGKRSWLDVTLEPGHYIAICMLPFGTGYPHAMDGMFVFFDIA